MTHPTPAIPRSVPDRLGWTIADAWTVARRDLIHWFRQPFGIIVTLLFPVMLVLMFGYLFGGAISLPGGNAAGGGDYREFLMPGMFAMTMAFGLEATMVSVSTDAARASPTGSVPCPWPLCCGPRPQHRRYAELRARSLRHGRLRPVIGWRWHESIGQALLAVGLLLLLRFSLLWVGIFLGLMVESPEAVAAVQILIWPVLFLSNTFVAPETMPGWLGAISE